MDTLEGPRLVFWHLEVKEHIYLRRLLIMPNHNVCFWRTALGEVCGKLRLWSNDDQLFSQAWLFHVQQHREVGTAGITGMDAGNTYTRALRRKMSSRFPPPTILNNYNEKSRGHSDNCKSFREATVTLHISDQRRNQSENWISHSLQPLQTRSSRHLCEALL